MSTQCQVNRMAVSECEKSTDRKEVQLPVDEGGICRCQGEKRNVDGVVLIVLRR